MRSIKCVPKIILRFSALPAGNYNGSFNNLGSNANFWTATENNSSNAYNRNFNTGASMNSNNNNKNNQYSVRLVKDSSGDALPASSLYPLLYRSYRLARKNKRSTKNQMRFEVALEPQLMSLSEDLANRTYKPLPSVCFINEKPVKREVIAADFRDRVVHHLLCGWLFPIFERRFIYDSYSCRKEKGTLFAVNRARGFLRSASDDFRQDCWVLRLDVKGFFMSINKEILFNAIMDGLARANYKGVDDIDLCNFLVRQIVFAKPLENAIFRSPPEAWNDLPSDKSLKNAGDERGLPIGNLTSQLFGNIYLDALDQYIKRELKIKCYGRYVDDMVLVHSDKSVLVDAIDKVRSFLKDKLKLTLHPKKISLQPASYGFNFLGKYILPYRVYPGRRLRKNSLEALQNCHSLKEYQTKLESYKGLYKYVNGVPKVYRKFFQNPKGGEDGKQTTV